MNYITYSSLNAPEAERWCAYLTVFKVFCFGPTEEVAKANAEAFFNKCRANVPAAQMNDEPIVKPTTGRGHSNTGKVWLWHPTSGYSRTPPEQVEYALTQGWVRKGPRSK